MPKRVPTNERLAIYQDWYSAGGDNSRLFIESLARKYKHEARTIKSIIEAEGQRERIELDRRVMDGDTPDMKILKRIAWLKVVEAVNSGAPWAVRAVLNDELKEAAKPAESQPGTKTDPANAFSE